MIGWVWGVAVVGAGTVCHMGGRVDFTLTFDSSPIQETFAKPTVIPA